MVGWRIFYARRHFRKHGAGQYVFAFQITERRRKHMLTDT